MRSTASSQACTRSSRARRSCLTSGVDQHHSQIRFAWAFVDKDGKRAIEGIDIGELADDGRLSRIVGFWGAPPPAS